MTDEATGSTKDDRQPGLQEIGSAIKLNSLCDPFHRISNKLSTFMTYVDLIPVDWDLDLPGFLKEGKEHNKGAVKYTFKLPIERFKNRCKKYGLPEKSGLRVVTSGTSSYSEHIENAFSGNMISTSVNETFAVTNKFRQLAGSGGLTPEEISNKVKTSGNFQKTVDAMKGVKEGWGGDAMQLAEDLIFKGRQLSLPKIYTGTTYTPSFQGQIKLVSPYGSPKAIQKHILEPLVYFLLLVSPDTSDGVSFGGYTFLKVKGYGICDISLGYLTNLTITRGGGESVSNKYGQPLSVTVGFNIASAFDGFACVNGDSSMEGTKLRKPGYENGTDWFSYVLDRPTGATDDEFSSGYEDLPHQTGMVTVDNVINSFKKFPGSDEYTNNGEFPSAGLTKGAAIVQRAVAEGGGLINQGRVALQGGALAALSAVLL
jgi:hypothetical protein